MYAQMWGANRSRPIYLRIFESKLHLYSRFSQYHVRVLSPTLWSSHKKKEYVSYMCSVSQSVKRPPSLSAFSGARRSITTSSLSDLGIVLPPFLKNKCLHRQSHRRYGRHQSAISVQRGKPVFPLCHNRARFVGESRPVLQGHNQYHSPPRLAVP